MKDAVLGLADGSVFRGKSVGARGRSSGELVFNTAITGYQEILTDPSYARQLVTLTHPHIGNTGTNDEDCESSRVWSAGLVVRDVPTRASSWRNQQDMSSFLREHGVLAISDVDTRAITRRLSSGGAQGAAIIAGGEASASVGDEAVALARSFPGLSGMDLAQDVTRAQVERWGEGAWSRGSGFETPETGDLHVVVYDFGVKRNILRMLVSEGCSVTVVPAKTPAQAVLDLKPDGVLLSNGPGDPEPCGYAVEAIQALLQRDLPIMGICLGYQLLALALGARTTKMPFGHHGANHPVQDLRDDSVLITSQNHGFAVDPESLPPTVEKTHVSLFDGSLQGIRMKDRSVFGFQGHPEASPGPHDARGMLADFVRSIRDGKAGSP